MHSEKPFEKIRNAIRDSLRRSGVGARTLESKLGLRPWSLRGILDARRPQVPSVDRAFEICQALGLEFYIGPPRDPSARPASASAAGDTKIDAEPPEWARRLRDDMRRDITKILGQAGNPEIPARVLQAPLHEMSAAGGEIIDDFDESVAGHITFSPRWLNRHGFFPPICTIISVKGDSMAPTLPHGSYLLVDRRLPELKDDRLFVVRTGDRLLVKRLKQDADGVWWLNSDNPAWQPVRWSDRVQLIGEVRWAGTLLSPGPEATT